MPLFGSGKPQKEDENMNTSPTKEDSSKPDLVDTLQNAATESQEKHHFHLFEGMSGKNKDDDDMEDFINLVG
ncbi:uncharacterized protein J8A68_003077 [[Candida] subhashii]|uniref:Uncharacterized protein n=1 Tax=[Candida] subhashii TaxID=561895 RepID=A0A8J5UX22_9ASCO|nr:uncharacterized protein J8A68_003077 [[Candida] subhashii]KAG7663425.1 hypothetical protein J8A68_003077 [[Candida] subhashii]